MLKLSKAAVKDEVELVGKDPLPTGGTTNPPISVSAFAIEVAIVASDAPSATLSLAAINWWASDISPLPLTGVFKIASS